MKTKLNLYIFRSVFQRVKIVILLIVVTFCSKEGVYAQTSPGSGIIKAIEISNPGLENSGEGWHILGHNWSEDFWSNDAYEGATSADISTKIERQRCVLMSPWITSLEPGTTIRICFYAKYLSGNNTVFVDFYTKGVVGACPGQWQGEIPKDGSWHQIQAEVEVPAYVKDGKLSIRIGLPYPKQSHWKKPMENFEATHYLIDNISIVVLDKEIHKMKEPREITSHSFDANDVRDNDSKFGIYWTPWSTFCRNILKTPQDANKSKEQIIKELDLMQEVGIKWIRSIWRWDKIEWEKGKPDYEFLDFVVEEAWKRDIRFLVGLYNTPSWTSTAPAGYAEYYSFPPKMNDWDNFVYHLVDHFKSKIKYWEIWNEPNHWFGYYWQGTTGDFFELQKVAYQAAKKADPTCMMLIGSFSDSGSGMLSHLLKMGIKDYFDIVSIHPYSNDKLNIDNAIYAVKAVRLILAQYEYDDKPIWFTEIGWPGDLASSVTDAQRADMLKIVYEYPFHEAVEKIFWFSFSGLVHMRTGNITKTSCFDAYREVTLEE